MVVLKKIRASTLMETLVATVLVVIIFMLASMILNSIFLSSIKNNTRAIEAELNELQYLNINNKLELPYQDTFRDWNISADQYEDNNQMVIEFEANNIQTKKTIVVKHHEAK